MLICPEACRVESMKESKPFDKVHAKQRHNSCICRLKRRSKLSLYILACFQ